MDAGGRGGRGGEAGRQKRRRGRRRRVVLLLLIPTRRRREIFFFFFLVQGVVGPWERGTFGSVGRGPSRFRWRDAAFHGLSVKTTSWSTLPVNPAALISDLSLRHTRDTTTQALLCRLQPVGVWTDGTGEDRVGTWNTSAFSKKKIHHTHSKILLPPSR